MSGKESTTKLLEAGFGLVERAGAVTSPHLFDFRERISIAGRYLEESVLTEIWETLIFPYYSKRDFECSDFRPSFQMTVALLALHAFQRSKVRMGVLESAVGGRYDLISFLHADAVVLTNVGSDHEHLLGSEEWQRALDKAGAARKGAPRRFLKICSISRKSLGLCFLFIAAFLCRKKTSGEAQVINAGTESGTRSLPLIRSSSVFL